MDLAWMIAFAVILLLIIWHMNTAETGYYRAKRDLARRVRIFSPDHFISFDGMGAVAIDRKSCKILFVEEAGSRQKVVSFADVLSVELIEDGTTITKTSSSDGRKLGREIVDTLIERHSAAAGPEVKSAGEAAGDTVRRIMMRIVVADVLEPCWSVFFWNDKGHGILKQSGQYVKARGQADHWCAMLQVIISKADEEAARPRQSEWRASVLG